MNISEIFIYNIYNNVPSLISNCKFKKQENINKDIDIVKMNKLVRRLYIDKEIKNEKSKSDINSKCL